MMVFLKGIGWKYVLLDGFFISPSHYQSDLINFGHQIHYVQIVIEILEVGIGIVTIVFSVVS